MNKKNILKYLIPVCLLLMSSTFVLSRYMQLSDGMNGFLKGVPIGIMLMAFILQRSKPAC